MILRRQIIQHLSIILLFRVNLFYTKSIQTKTKKESGGSIPLYSGTKHYLRDTETPAIGQIIVKAHLFS
jgi:hypothetical protein